MGRETSALEPTARLFCRLSAPFGNIEGTWEQEGETEHRTIHAGLRLLYLCGGCCRIGYGNAALLFGFNKRHFILQLSLIFRLFHETTLLLGKR